MSAAATTIAGVVLTVALVTDRSRLLLAVTLPLATTASLLALGCVRRSEHSRVRRTEGAAAEQSRLAVLEERRRIARDVHDVIANSLTIMMVHLNSARLRVLDDPHGTADVLDELVRYGRRSLEEVRCTVGLLSQSPSPAEPAGAIETARAIEELVATYRHVGVELELRLDVEMAHMALLAHAPPQVWLAGYRIVQEAIANAARHAPGAAIDVRIGVDDAGVHILVTNPISVEVVILEPPSGGHGIRGMRERAAQLGGRVVVRPEAGAWTVHAEIPLSANASAPRRSDPLGCSS